MGSVSSTSAERARRGSSNEIAHKEEENNVMGAEPRADWNHPSTYTDPARKPELVD